MRASRPVDVGPADTLKHGERTIVSIGKREIAIIRWRDRYYALSNVCPHQGAPVCGAVVPGIGSDGAGHVTVDTSAPVVQCTWHRWEFDLNTGQAVCDPAMKLKRFAAYVAEGRILVDL